MRAEAVAQRLAGAHARIEQCYAGGAGRCERGGNGRAYSAATDNQSAGAGNAAPRALNTSNETRAVKHVSEQRPIGTTNYRIARARNLYRGTDLIEQGNGRHLVRHRHQRAAYVGQLKQRLE